MTEKVEIFEESSSTYLREEINDFMTDPDVGFVKTISIQFSTFVIPIISEVRYCALLVYQHSETENQPESES